MVQLKTMAECSKEGYGSESAVLSMMMMMMMMMMMILHYI
jgi:hypothetical protein